MNCTVLVHGFFSTGIFMDFLAEKLKGTDMDTIAPTFPTTTNSVDDCAVLLDKFLYDKINNYETIHFAGHSMGGLVIRKYLLDNCPQNIGRCVFIGTPHKGSVLADLGARMLPDVAAMLGGVESLKQTKEDKYVLENIEIGCIAGTKPMLLTMVFFGDKVNDGEVELSSAISGDAKESVSINYSHIELCKKEQTVHLVKRFLETGTFVDSGSHHHAAEDAGMNTNLLTEGLRLLSSGERLPAMPNIPFPTMGGQVFWNELANVHGWRVQQNMITQHCRVLDPNDMRAAWGGVDAVMEAFERLVKNSGHST